MDDVIEAVVGKDELVIFKNTQEPIVDEETWNMVQELRKTVRRHDILDEANAISSIQVNP